MKNCLYLSGLLSIAFLSGCASYHTCGKKSACHTCETRTACNTCPGAQINESAGSSNEVNTQEPYGGNYPGRTVQLPAP